MQFNISYAHTIQNTSLHTSVIYSLSDVRIQQANSQYPRWWTLGPQFQAPGPISLSFSCSSCPLDQHSCWFYSHLCMTSQDIIISSLSHTSLIAHIPEGFNVNSPWLSLLQVFSLQAHYSENTKRGMWLDSQYVWAQITVKSFNLAPMLWDKCWIIRYSRLSHSNEIFQPALRECTFVSYFHFIIKRLSCFNYHMLSHRFSFTTQCCKPLTHHLVQLL